jgi:hypothetical protein
LESKRRWTRKSKKTEERQVGEEKKKTKRKKGRIKRMNIRTGDR